MKNKLTNANDRLWKEKTTKSGLMGMDFGIKMETRAKKMK